MSYGNAVRQREEMLTAYRQMLETETDLVRKADIEKQIALIQDQISQLKIGKPLFGKVKPLNITTTYISPNPEKPGEQIVTVVNPQPVPAPQPKPVALTESFTTPPKRLGNKLRDTLNNKLAASTEDSLQAQIQAAKANKKSTT